MYGHVRKALLDDEPVAAVKADDLGYVNTLLDQGAKPMARHEGRRADRRVTA